MFIPFQRVLRLGLEKFLRDKSSSGAALFVTTVVLIVVTTLVLMQGVASFITTSLEQSVDVSAFITDTATDQQIDELRQALQQLPEVQEVSFVSKEQALQSFVEIHKQDEVILRSLEIVGQNPLQASFSIKAVDVSQYPAIATFVETSEVAFIVSEVDYFDRAPVIERLNSLTQGVRSIALLITLFAGFVAILVAFNTIRLTIYNSRDEIEIMRLVGASNWFIRGPFVVQGVIVGGLATLITTLLLFPLTLFFSLELQSFAPGFSLFSYFISHFFLIFFLQLVVGMGLGAASSMIAIKRYLKV